MPRARVTSCTLSPTLPASDQPGGPPLALRHSRGQRLNLCCAAPDTRGDRCSRLEITPQRAQPPLGPLSGRKATAGFDPTPPSELATSSAALPPAMPPSTNVAGPTADQVAAPPMALQPPPAVVAQPVVPTVITHPDWIAKPSGDDVGTYYPDRAQRMSLGGEVTLACTVAKSGALTACQVTAENPPDQDFGSAALNPNSFGCGPKRETLCGSACNRDPLGGVIGVEEGPLIPMD